jgi:hypothetical protein
VAYLALASVTWAFGISCILLGILHGKVPLLLRWFTGDMWVPYAGLTYGVFLGHYGIQSGVFTGTFMSYHWQGLNLITDFLFTMCGSWIIGAVYYAVFEAPFILLEKRLFYPQPEPVKKA